MITLLLHYILLKNYFAIPLKTFHFLNNLSLEGAEEKGDIKVKHQYRFVNNSVVNQYKASGKLVYSLVSTILKVMAQLQMLYSD